MIHKFIVALLFVTLDYGFSFDALATEPSPRIKKLTNACLACHGVENMKLDPAYSVPKLGFQHSQYIVSALKDYKSGRRSNLVMQQQVDSLTEVEMEELAALLSNEKLNTLGDLKLPTPPKVHPAKVIAVCGACHGETGLGNMVEYPVLAGQNADYLIHALKEYRNGHRIDSIMNGITKSLNDDEIDIVAAYFSKQTSQASLKIASSGLDNAVNSIEMINLPGAEFWMGEEPGKGFVIGWPKRGVSIKPFRLGKFSITFQQYDAFTADTSRPQVDDSGWGRGNRPVINVNWTDIQDFIEWLNLKTNRHFRLPSEAEREYATAAGTSTNNWWGDKTDPAYLNVRGINGRDRWQFTAPVGQFPPNPFGLYDLAGNVWERTADCWHPSYDGAPNDGKAWYDEACTMHVIRGGYWNTPGVAAYSRARAAAGDAFRGSGLGFRLAESI